MSYKNSLTKDITVSVIIATVLTGISYIVGLHFGWETHLNWLEVFAVWTSYSCTWLCNQQRRSNYPIGAASTGAYALLFYQAKLFGSALVNLYLTPQLVYGWFRWRKDKDTRPVTKVGWKWWIVYGVSTAAFYTGAVFILGATGAHLALIDAFVLVGSILAQWLLDNKKLANWYIWFIVDVVAIVDYATIGLPLVAFQYVFFLLNTVYGWYLWRKSMKIGSDYYSKVTAKRTLSLSDELAVQELLAK